MTIFLPSFKAAAAEGAVLELKLRLLAGNIPELQPSALAPDLKNVESRIIAHFAESLSDEEKRTLARCRELRNKVLHADFHAARSKLNEIGIETLKSGVKRVDIPVISVAAIAEVIRGVQSGTEGIVVADTPSTAAGSVYGWFMEAGAAGDFEKACEVFKKTSAVLDRLAGAGGL